MANKENQQALDPATMNKDLREISDISALLNTIEATLDSYESKVLDFDKKIKEMAREAVEKDDEEFEIKEESSSEDNKNKVVTKTVKEDKSDKI